MDWRKTSDPQPNTSNAGGRSICSTTFNRPYRGNHVRPFACRGARSSNLFSFHCLETLQELSKKNSSEIIMELIAKNERFAEFLKSSLEPDWIVVTVAILAKVCSSAFTENSIVIINVAAKASFTKTLEKYVANLQYEEADTRDVNKCFWNNTDEFFVNLSDVCDCFIETIPTKACEVLPKLLKVVDVSVPTLKEQQGIELGETTKAKIKTLIQKLELCQEELEQMKRAKENAALPPNDFRTLSVYPTCKEILSPDPAFVRKNIIEGRYDNVEHYLDVQFRLLKEDFVGHLRQGIAEYFKESQGPKKYMNFSNVKIHPDVVFQSLTFENDVVGVVLKFSNKKSSDRIFSERYKGLKDGSLVCFTKDYFGTILFGKVLERDYRQNQLVISLDAEYNDFDLNVPYLMVECKIFFELYYHVLKALQCMSEVDFPMKKYLINVDFNVEPPGYLNEGSSVFTIDEHGVDLLGNNWPTAEQLQLNSSQYSAFKAALTQKFVVIQGPPGTGKTYLGLRIVKTLLHKDNIKFWYNETPILIVCLTSHALDQFLQGLTSTTRNIIRVGGRSKCEELNEFNLRDARNSSHMVHGALIAWRKNVQDLLIELKKFSDNLKQIKMFNHIIHFEYFRCIDKNIADSWFSRATNSDLLTWLFADRRNKDVKLKLDAMELSEIEEDVNEEPTSTRGQVFDEDYFPNVIDDEFDVSSTPRLTVLDSKHEMLTKIKNIQKMIQVATQQTDYVETWELETYLSDLCETFQYFKMRMRDGETSLPPLKPRNVNYDSPHHMHPNDRWNLYFYWLNLYQQYTVTKLVELQKEYQQVYKKYTEVRNIIDSEIMKSKLVVGMTTTSAARLQTTLQTLKCRIVVVEEAAEVLESHVTVSLTSHCQHLILIGDHQQLRPTTADYRIEKKFNLRISMFERMVRNKIRCNTLGVQHRMRPEIANLIVPHIYPELENHHSVTGFPPMLGMDSCLYFIHHEHRELDEFDTKSNLHEAKFLANLARYLRQNGYEPKDITILAAYAGQYFALRDEIEYNEAEQNEGLLEGVRICVLDNYQGEECKIILLSLVRNNLDGQIGFLKIENRVCVALSRAREGLFIMGNIDLLCRNSEIWPKIKEVLVKQNSLGNYLSVCCRNHPDQVTKIKEPEDFENVPEGGCNIICGSSLKCGHYCRKTCHIIDSDHRRNMCTVRCSKVICDKGHLCKKMCSQYCGSCSTNITGRLECGHEHTSPCYKKFENIMCEVLVTATLPCGHEVLNKPCYTDVSKFKCSFPCNLRIEHCGHSCKFECHVNTEPCTESCMELVEHTNKGACGHNIKVVCHMLAKNLSSNDTALLKLCTEPCSQILECSHKCSGSCGDCFQGRLHLVCSEKCGNTLVCGHKCNSLCGDVCKPCGIKCSSKCSHTKCEKKCWQPCIKCEAPCSRECKHRRCTAKCWQQCKVESCQNPCEKMLICGHPCVGFCGEPCPQLCRICDRKILTEIFLGYEDQEDAKFVLLDECKHVIESKGLERYFHKGDTENGVLVECKRCPRCETPLESTLRYKDYIKESKADAVDFQKRAYGGRFEMERQFKEVKENLKLFYTKISKNSSLQFLLAPVRECLGNEKTTFNFVVCKIIQTKLCIFKSIYYVLDLAELNSTARKELVQYLHFLLEFLGNQDAKFTTQIIIDFQREMCRLQRIAQIFYILYLHETVSSNETKEFIFRPIPYTKGFDDEVKQKLEELYAQLGQQVPDIPNVLLPQWPF